VEGDPQLVPRDALSGRRIAVSVSESADLQRLGLSDRHLQLTIAELSRAIVIAGGIVVYGGAIQQGFTKIVLEETEKYGNVTGAFEHIVPYTEHAKHSPEELTEYAASLGVKSTVRLMDSDGAPRSVRDLLAAAAEPSEVDAATALGAMRTYTAEITDARVVVGGKVSGFAGSAPGVAEEAAATLRAGKPLYVAGGFGGAATLVGSIVTPDLYRWLPPRLPDELTPEVRQLVESALDLTLPADGLRDEERALLAETHRPSDIATLVVLGLSRLLGEADMSRQPSGGR
jgi:SLOG-like protein